MGTFRYKIAGHFCEINFKDTHNGEALLPSFSSFQSDEEGKLLFSLEVDDAFRWGEQGKEVGQFDCGGNNFGVYMLSDGAYQFKICNPCHQLCCLMQSNPDFSECKAAIIAESFQDRLFGLNNALMLIYAFASAPYRTLLVHASVIRKSDNGYLFLGKSGTGKSTHTRLWLSHIPDCDLMNDDNPVVRVIDEKVLVYGSPWSGKTPCYRNIVAQVGAFVQLQQKPENIIRRLNVLEGFSYLLPSISTMKWDKRIYTANCDTISDIIRFTPIYHLGCLPDKEAAELSYRTVALK